MRSRLVIVTIVAALSFAACGGDDDTAPVAAERPSHAPSDSSPVTEDGGGYGDKERSSRLTLQEGIITQSEADYTTGRFQPRATFHTPALAYPFFPELESARGVILGSEAGALLFLRPAKIFDPTSGRLVSAPADLTEWATSNAHVKASEVEPVKIAGAPGTEVTGAVTSVLDKSGDCQGPCIRFAPTTPKDSVWFLKGDRFRLVSLDVAGDAVGIVVVSDKAGFGQINGFANQLLKTLRFHP